MKSAQFPMIPLAFCLGLAGCRAERKNTGNAPPQQKDPGSGSNSPSPEPLEPKKTQLPAIRQDNRPKNDPKKSDESSAEELLLRMSELERAEVFDVPISANAGRDRAEAWNKLTSEVPHEILKKEQYLHARDLLDRYREAPPLERLVFWHLVKLRLYNQRVSSIARVAGDDYRELRLSMDPKLTALLYSVLGDDSKTLPEFLAARKAIEMLKAAAEVKNPSGH